MKTSTILALGVAVTLAVGVAAAFAYPGIGGYNSNPLQTRYAGTMGGRGYPGMMGAGMGYGMGYSGMMGGAQWSFGYSYGNGNFNRFGNWSSAGYLVRMIGNSFYPQSITVPAGTTVTWVNMDFVQHTVTSGSEASPTLYFDSHELGHMQGFSYTFSAPGTYAYFCDIHPGMVGSVTVTA
jgi:plastocyanin